MTDGVDAKTKVDKRFARYVRPFIKELSTIRFWVLLGITVICLLLSAVIEADLQIEALGWTEQEQHNRILERWHESSEVLAGFLREVGFATFIALVIIILVERGSREEQLSAAKDTLALVSQDVFKAVLGTNTPQSVVRQAMGTIFSAPVVRHGLRLTFTVEALPPEHKEWQDRCLQMHVNSSYELENVTGAPVNWDIKVYLPVPSYPEMEKLAGITSVSFTDQRLPKEKIQQGNDAIENTDYEIRYRWTEEIRPEKRLRVAANYTVIKEISDNELWTSLLPSTSIEVTVDMRIPGHIWNVDTLHSGNLKPLDAPEKGPYSERRIVFRSEEALLPFQGVLLWWRPDRRPKDEVESEPDQSRDGERAAVRPVEGR